MFRPDAMLIAEDQAGWDGVTRAPDAGGLGSGATRQAALDRNLIGDSVMAVGRARLLKEAGFGRDGPLAGESSASPFNPVVEHLGPYQARNSTAVGVGLLRHPSLASHTTGSGEMNNTSLRLV